MQCTFFWSKREVKKGEWMKAADGSTSAAAAHIATMLPTSVFNWTLQLGKEQTARKTHKPTDIDHRAHDQLRSAAAELKEHQKKTADCCAHICAAYVCSICLRRQLVVPTHVIIICPSVGRSIGRSLLTTAQRERERENGCFFHQSCPWAEQRVKRLIEAATVVSFLAPLSQCDYRRRRRLICRALTFFAPFVCLVVLVVVQLDVFDYYDGGGVDSRSSICCAKERARAREGPDGVA